MLGEEKLEITEVPLKTSITNYKAMLEFMMTGLKSEEDGGAAKKAAPAKGKDKDKDKEDKASKKDALLIK